MKTQPPPLWLSIFGLSVVLIILLTSFFILSSHPSTKLAVTPLHTQNWKTEINSQYHFQIKYPDFVNPIFTSQLHKTTFIPICEDNFLFCLYYPESLFPETDFAGAGFGISKIENAKSIDQCSSFANSDIFPATKILINGIAFYHQQRGSAATGHQEDTHYYRTFHNNSCFEIDLRITTESRVENYPPGSGYQPFTVQKKTKVLDDLKNILSTFKFI